MAGSEPTTRRRPEIRTDQRESDDHAHIVMKGDQMRGYVAGQAIKALCGKVFVPSRDYEGLPLCQECVEERDRILAGIKRFN